jgi:hypothetical protein
MTLGKTKDNIVPGHVMKAWVLYGGDLSSNHESSIFEPIVQSTISTGLFQLGGPPKYLCPCQELNHGCHGTTHLRIIFIAVTYPTWRFLKRIVSDFGSFSCESIAASFKGWLNSQHVCSYAPVVSKRMAIVIACDMTFIYSCLERDRACAACRKAGKVTQTRRKTDSHNTNCILWEQIDITVCATFPTRITWIRFVTRSFTI